MNTLNVSLKALTGSDQPIDLCCTSERSKRWEVRVQAFHMCVCVCVCVCNLPLCTTLNLLLQDLCASLSASLSLCFQQER